MTIQLYEFNPQDTEPINAAEVHDSCRVYLWAHQHELTKLHDIMSELCQSQLSESHANGEQNKRPQSVKRQIETLSLNIMCRTIFGGEVNIVHTVEGKPKLAGSVKDDFYISISHTKELYTLSVATRPHGIDIEHKSGRALRIKDKFLSAKEEEIELNLFPAAEDKATALWCAKEAAFKTFSSPTLTLLNQVVLTEESDGKIVAYPLEKKGSKARVSFYQTGDCILAVSIQGTN